MNLPKAEPCANLKEGKDLLLLVAHRVSVRAHLGDPESGNAQKRILRFFFIQNSTIIFMNLDSILLVVRSMTTKAANGSGAMVLVHSCAHAIHYTT